MESSDNIELASSNRLEPNEVVLIDDDNTVNQLEMNPSCSSQSSNEASKLMASQSDCNINTEKLTDDTNNPTEESGASGSTTGLDCPVCLQPCIHPARLPCGHIFCFLCIKGVAYKNQRCAMCRRDIPSEFLERPQLVNGLEDICKLKCTEDGYQWFYEGRNGWWQYDIRTCQDIEDAYKKGEKSCTILVAGYVYIVDLEAMVQQRQSEPTRCRRVKRDLATVPKKGVAGLRIDHNSETEDVTNSGNNIPQTYNSDLIDEEDIESFSNTLLSVSSPISSGQSNNFMLTLNTQQQQEHAQTSSDLNARQANTINISTPTENILREQSENSRGEINEQTAINGEQASNFISNTQQNRASGSQSQRIDDFDNILTSLQQMSLRASQFDMDSIERRGSGRHKNPKRF